MSNLNRDTDRFGCEGIQTGWVNMVNVGDAESLSQALGVAWRGKGQRYAPGRATASGERAGLGAILWRTTVSNR